MTMQKQKYFGFSPSQLYFQIEVIEIKKMALNLKMK